MRSGQPKGRQRRDAVVFLLPLALYLAFPTKDFYPDGVVSAIDIEKAARGAYPLVHANHLIYGVAGYWLFRAISAVESDARALYLLQSANSVLATLCVLLVYLLLVRDGATRNRAATAAWLLAFSATWWKFATDANPYIPAVFFLLASYALLGKGRKPQPYYLAILHSAAMLFHQLGVLFWPVALAGLWRQQTGKWRDRIRPLLEYSAAACALTLGAYRYAWGTLEGRRPGFLAWITSHAADAQFSFDIGRNAWLTLLGTGRLFAGGRLNAVESRAAGAVGLTAIAVALVAVAVVVGKAGVPAWAELRRCFSAAPELLVWIGVYMAFLFFWMPQNVFYRLLYVPAMVLLLDAVLEAVPARWALALVVAATGIWNFPFLVHPDSRPQANETLRFALQQGLRWPPGTGILFHEFNPALWTISYFNPQVAWIGLELPDLTLLDKHENEFARSGGTLWLEATAYDFIARTPEGKQWLASHVNHAVIRFHTRKHDFRYYR